MNAAMTVETVCLTSGAMRMPLERMAQSAARPKLRGTITVTDQGCGSDGFHALLGRWGAVPAFRRKPAFWHRGYYRKRQELMPTAETPSRSWNTGHQQNDRCFRALVRLAAMLDWLKNRF